MADGFPLLSRLAAPALDLAAWGDISLQEADWRTAALVLAVAVLLATWLLPAVLEEVELPPTVHLRSERRSIRRLRLPRKRVVLSKRLAAQSAQSAHASRLEAVRQTLLAGWQHARPSRWELLELDCEGMSEDRRPLLVFVNSRSGGGQGMEVLRELRMLLHQVQVVHLQEEGPEAALRWWASRGQRYRVLVCGGDGTVGWVLGVLEQLQLEYVPPVAILPLGTGNDLARVCGWGGGFAGGSVAPLLRKVDQAHAALLDRWAVACRDSLPAERPAALPAMVEARERRSLVMCNYLGIGVDAAVALDFHQMRERSPHLFVSRLVNKLWYLKSGTKNIFHKACADLASKVTLECDGVPVAVPPRLEGIVVLNIRSFGGGSDLWGSAEDGEGESGEEGGGGSSSGSESSSSGASVRRDGERRDLRDLSRTRASMQDRRLEVVGVHGSLQLGAAQVGLYSAKRLAQASHVRITNRVSLPIEVDGEPWLFHRNGEVEISWKSQAFMLARRAPGGHAVATDVVDWALQRQIIGVEQRNQLMTEIARRAQEASSATDLASMG